LNNGGIGPSTPEIPENPMFNMKPNALIYEAQRADLRRPL
jgi:2-hydroxyacyl-CoA lyase 1